MSEAKRFKISYPDPNNEDYWLEEILEFYDTGSGKTFISAETWAEDYAYAKTDKGRYTIKEVL